MKKLPQPLPWYTLLGPAFVWAATAQGSGELIWWPYLVARYGEAFLCLLLPAALVQFFVNREVSKYTAITGKGIWRDLSVWENGMPFPSSCCVLLTFYGWEDMRHQEVHLCTKFLSGRLATRGLIRCSGRMC